MSPRLDWPAESVSAPTVMKHAVLVCFLQQVVVIQSCVSLTDSVGAGASRYWWNLACRATIHVANDRRASKETHSLPMLIARTVPTVPVYKNIPAPSQSTVDEMWSAESVPRSVLTVLAVAMCVIDSCPLTCLHSPQRRKQHGSRRESPRGRLSLKRNWKTRLTLTDTVTCGSRRNSELQDYDCNAD